MAEQRSARAEKHSPDAEKPSEKSSRNGRKEPAELARTAVRTLIELTGRRPETVLGLRKQDDGWQVLVEVLEMSRVPTSTDLLGCYAVTLDEAGEVVGYERRRRYQRGQTGGDDQ